MTEVIVKMGFNLTEMGDYSALQTVPTQTKVPGPRHKNKKREEEA
jgi:hypothetical protein